MTSQLTVVSERLRFEVEGSVQGVGFRPFVYRLANEFGLNGWVRNSSDGVLIEVEGTPEALDHFLVRLRQEKPAAAVIQSYSTAAVPARGDSGFQILPSLETARKTAGIQADLATCPECLRELFDPNNRRYLYPFTNCTNCGPRYTIVRDIPYDRPNTTMAGFALCPDCATEYRDPANRRFHAQPNACPRCGPRLSESIGHAAAALRRGDILALKGIGGFQLLVDARNPEAVERLRKRKHREEKPFALLMPSLEMARQYCEVSPAEEELLRSRAAPIALLRPGGQPGIAANVAKSSPFLGVMLPYSPLHHLLTREFPFPLVATSGNRSEEPIAIDNDEALSRLHGIGDAFLLHDRPIARPCDDSVARVVHGTPSVIRRARGYAPLPVAVPRQMSPVLAVGGHMKNTVAIAIGKQVILSQHIGDLDTIEARQAFHRGIDDLCRLYEFEPQSIACDIHPDYASTRWARDSHLPVIAVQHHQAHIAACAAENGVVGPYLGIAWDGTGYGLDGTIWGSEIFLVDDHRFDRISHLRPFRLPGGEAAARDCSRCADSIRIETGIQPASAVIARMLERNVHSPLTTSMGRLFDAISCITGVARKNRFEGQAAMMLEREIGQVRTDDAYPLPEGGGEADWRPMIQEITDQVRRRVPTPLIAARFHNALVEWIVRLVAATGSRQLVLSGGVFQNRYLTERVIDRLESKRLAVFTHHQVPANDGGIALGQAVLASAIIEQRGE